jgi:hypothetical protein
VALGNFTADGEADPSSLVRPAAVQALEHVENPVEVFSSNPIPLSATRISYVPTSPLWPSTAADVIRTTGGTSGRRNLSALAIRFWKSWRHLHRVGVDRGERIDLDLSAAGLDSRLQVHEHFRHDLAEVDRRERLGLGRHARERQQVVDQRLHARRGGVHSVDVIAPSSPSGAANRVRRRSPNCWIFRSGSCRSCEATEAKVL